jgi:hypothetical protein
MEQLKLREEQDQNIQNQNQSRIDNMKYETESRLDSMQDEVVANNSETTYTSTPARHYRRTRHVAPMSSSSSSSERSASVERSESIR